MAWYILYPVPSNSRSVNMNVTPGSTRNHPRASPLVPVSAVGIIIVEPHPSPKIVIFFVICICGPSA